MIELLSVGACSYIVLLFWL